jgi:hypothetical protein
VPVDRTTDRPANRFPNKGVGRRDKMTAVSVSPGDGPLRIVVTMEGTRSGPAAAVQQGDRSNVGLACWGFPAEIHNYPLSDCRGIFCSSIRVFHLGSLIAVLHVAELDKYRRILGQI